MSELRVDKISPRSGTALQIGDASDVITIPANATITNLGTATGFGGGISNAQQFRIIADQAGSGSAGTVLTNWEEVDTDYQAIGSNWSQSSGIFSCSGTGIYLCMWQLSLSNVASTGDGYDPNVQISTNSGGAYTTRSSSFGQGSATHAQRNSVSNTFLFDVSNTSTFRLRMRESGVNDVMANSTIQGSTTASITTINFIRLADT